jgi:predicted NUDIX family phosphoesterase
MKHQEHIICIKSSMVENHKDGFIDYELNLHDLMMGQRASLETDNTFRQVLPISVFTHQGKVWAYRRTSKGGDDRLHSKISVAVGGHWDMEDLVLVNGVIDLHESLNKAMERELGEEIRLTSSIISSTTLEKKICCSDTEVDSLHLGIVHVHELDGDGIHPIEDQLESIGFASPTELLVGDYNLETWAKIICNILVQDN